MITNKTRGTMTDKEINEKVGQLIFGLVQGKDFGEWAEHDWAREVDDNDTLTNVDESVRMSSPIDDCAFDSEYHNGPRCRRCGHYFCMHCSDDYEKELHEGPCIVDAPDYITYWNRVVKVTIKKGMSMGVSFEKNTNEYACSIVDNKNSFKVTDANLGRAICRVAIRAFEVRKENGRV